MGRSWAAILIAAAVSGAVPAHAGGVDVFGGYSFTRYAEESFHGGNLGATWRPSARLGLTFDLGFHRKSEDAGSLSLFSTMLGPELVLVDGKMRLFVHALAGRVRERA